MDAIQDWAAYLLDAHGPAALQSYAPYARPLYSLLNTTKAYLQLLIDQVSSKPDLATIALLLIILFVSLKILDMLYQTLLFWVRLAWRALFWGGMVALAVWMYARGPEGVVEDVRYWAEVWGKERDYWREKERVARYERMRGPQVHGWF